MSAYHLKGIFGNSGANSNGTAHPGGKFSEKRYLLFLAFTGIPENFCTFFCPLLQYQALHGNTSEKEF